MDSPYFIVFQVALYILTPLAMLYFTARYARARQAGVVLLCFLTGILLANLTGPLLHPDVSRIFSTAPVLFALPLFLMHVRLATWLSRYLGQTIIGGLFFAASLAVSAPLASQYLYPGLEESWKVAGILAGLFTGGSLNLNELVTRLEASQSTAHLISVSEMSLSGLYFLFCLILLNTGRFIRWLGRRPKTSREAPETGQDDIFDLEQHVPEIEKDPERTLRDMVLGFFWALGIVGVALVTGWMFGGEQLPGQPLHVSIPVTLTIVTALGSLSSLIPRLRETTGSSDLGSYLVLVAVTAMGSQTLLFNIPAGAWPLILFGLAVLTGSLVLYILLIFLFRLNRPLNLLIHIGGVFDPFAVLPVVEFLKNRNLLLSGVLIGLAGYPLAVWLGGWVSGWIAP